MEKKGLGRNGRLRRNESVETRKRKEKEGKGNGEGGSLSDLGNTKEIV